MKKHASVNESTVSHLDYIENKLHDPGIYSAAYNFGLGNVLKYTESGRELPGEIMQYVNKVSHYIKIFNEMRV